MHITFTDQDKDSKPTIMCVEKSVNVVIVLSAPTVHEADLCALMASAMKTVRVMALVPADQAHEYECVDWSPVSSERMVLMEKCI